MPLGALVTAGQAHESKSFESLMDTVRIRRRRRPSAVAGDPVEAHIAVLIYSDSRILQSTWENDATRFLSLQPEALVPGLNEAVLGMKVGETRKIVLPADVAYPDGYPVELGLAAQDALVFVVELVAIEDAVDG